MILHFILACHNRRSSTLACIRSAAAGASAVDVAFDFTLFDDGSTDGTAESVLREYEKTTILRGDGSHYWAKSMSLAESAVLARIRNAAGSQAYIVWLNDDVILDDDALPRLVNLARTTDRYSILIGAVRDPNSGLTTYSGLNRRGLHPLKYRPVAPTMSFQSVDSFNGNLVLVPAEVALQLKGIDGSYAHGMADIDYGVRATRIGVNNILAPGTFGICPRNGNPAYKGFIEEWRDFTGAKGAGNFGSLRKLLRVNSPRLWPFYFLLTYITWFGRTLIRSLTRIRKVLT